MDFLALTSGNYLEFPAIPTNSCENLVEKKSDFSDNSENLRKKEAPKSLSMKKIFKKSKQELHPSLF